MRPKVPLKSCVSHEISQHSAHFLQTLVGIHEFCSAYMSAKYGKKHGYEWLMHVFRHLREQKLHAFRAFPRRGIIGGVVLLRLYLIFVMFDNLLSC